MRICWPGVLRRGTTVHVDGHFHPKSFPSGALAVAEAVNALVSEARATLPRHDLSAGSVVAVLAVITLTALAAVLALSYAMYLRNRR